MRISSSTASTLAIPARKIAWLSARISLSMLSALPKIRCHPEAGVSCPAKDLGEPHDASRFLRCNNSCVWLASLLRVPHKLVRVDHAGYPFAIFAGPGGVGAHYAPLALDHDVFLPSGNIGRQRDFKFHRRDNL